MADTAIGELRKVHLPPKKLEKCSFCSKTTTLRLCSSCGEVTPDTTMFQSNLLKMPHTSNHTAPLPVRRKTGRSTRYHAVRFLKFCQPIICSNYLDGRKNRSDRYSVFLSVSCMPCRSLSCPTRKTSTPSHLPHDPEHSQPRR